MTGKFDPNATPESDFALMDRELRQDLSFVLRKQERRARLAEEKLRIAVEMIKKISVSSESENARVSRKCFTLLQEIERVEK